MGNHGILFDLANYSTVALCLILKVPQIYSVLSTKSIHGLSLPGVLLELTSYSIMMCYNIVNGYPLLAFLEYPFLVVQDIVLLTIILHYKSKLNVFTLAAFGVYFSALYSVGNGILPLTVLATMAGLCTPIAAMSKLAHLKALHTAKSSKSVSVLSWTISAYTCLTRIYTTVIGVIDIPLLANFTVSLTLNLTIISYAIYLRRPAVSKNDKKDN